MKPRQLRGPALRRAQGVEEREPHVGDRELGQHRAVHELHERVDDRLRMDDHVEPVGRKPEEPARLDDLESLVHQGRAIDRDALSHGPGRVLQNLRGSRVLDGRRVPAQEGPAGRRERDAADVRDRPGCEALSDAAVLRIHGNEAPPRALRDAQEKLPREHHRFLVREGHPLPGRERRDSGLEPDPTHDRVHDHVDAVLRRERGQGLLPLQHFPALPGAPGATRRFGIHERDPRHAEFFRGADQRSVIRPRRERDEPDPVRVGPRQVLGRGSDRAGGSEERDTPHLRKTSHTRK